LYAFDEQAEAVEGREAFGTEDFVQSARARPGEGRLEEGGRGGEVVFALEEVKERSSLAVVVVVVAVVEDGDAAEGTRPLVSEKERGAGMFIEREPLRVKSEAFVRQQGRDPLGDVPIDGKR